eukprot:9133889-Alexandrium_andersonii.AAC.1
MCIRDRFKLRAPQAMFSTSARKPGPSANGRDAMERGQLLSHRGLAGPSRGRPPTGAALWARAL